ncbi:hypothetical protein AA313_de0209172 [Arthrobotrys entomopaga]|nr:hypothetical protein AA313_de0209172 [Arthrobotrys entomopaga]
MSHVIGRDLYFLAFCHRLPGPSIAHIIIGTTAHRRPIKNQCQFFFQKVTTPVGSLASGIGAVDWVGVGDWINEVGTVDCMKEVTGEAVVNGVVVSEKPVVVCEAAPALYKNKIADKITRILCNMVDL